MLLEKGLFVSLLWQVPELAGFWLLTLLLQFPLTLFQLFNEAILIQPLERGVHIVLALFLLIEVRMPMYLSISNLVGNYNLRKVFG